MSALELMSRCLPQAATLRKPTTSCRPASGKNFLSRPTARNLRAHATSNDGKQATNSSTAQSVSIGAGGIDFQRSAWEKAAPLRDFDEEAVEEDGTGMPEPTPQKPYDPQSDLDAINAVHVCYGTAGVQRSLSSSVRAIMLSQGPSTSKNPLTEHVALSTLQLGVSYKIIDFQLSALLESGVSKISVLTQHNSSSLINHVATAFPPRAFGAPHDRISLDCNTAHQTMAHQAESAWFRGSGDAVYKHLSHEAGRSISGVQLSEPSEYLILPADAVFGPVDYAGMVAAHRNAKADVTILAAAVSAGEAMRSGLMRTEARWAGSCSATINRVLAFVERPTGRTLKSMAWGSELAALGAEFTASTGAYVFSRRALLELLELMARTNLRDVQPWCEFGNDLVPAAISSGYKVQMYAHRGYWRPIASLQDYYDANLDLIHAEAHGLPLHAEVPSIMSAGHVLPPSVFGSGVFDDSLIGQGCTVGEHVRIENSVVGHNTRLADNVRLDSVVVVGSGGAAVSRDDSGGGGGADIGRGAVLYRCIVDRGAKIGAGARLTNAEGVREAVRSEQGITISDSIICVHGNATIAAGTVI